MVKQLGLEQLVREIKGFEIGRSALDNKIPEAGEDVWELKSKKYRILLQHIDGRFYFLYRVGPHGDSHRIFMAR